MSVEIKTAAIEPVRQTFSHVARRLGADKPASRYQEATFDLQSDCNFHYRPLWDPEHELYDKRRTAIRMNDWYAFKDPRQFYYATYVLNRAKLQDTAENNFDFVERHGALDLPPHQSLVVMHPREVLGGHLQIDIAMPGQGGIRGVEAIAGCADRRGPRAMVEDDPGVREALGQLADVAQESRVRAARIRHQLDHQMRLVGDLPQAQHALAGQPRVTAIGRALADLAKTGHAMRCGQPRHRDDRARRVAAIHGAAAGHLAGCRQTHAARRQLRRTFRNTR